MSEERNDQQQQSQPPTSTGFGAELRAARESRNVSEIELADKLKLSSQVIEALEAEDLETLPAATFVRGYIRAVATELSLDSDALVDQFNRMVPSEELELGSTTTAMRQPSSKDPAMVYGSIAIAAIFVVLLAIWGFGAISGDPAEPVEPAQEEVSEPAVDDESPLPSINIDGANPPPGGQLEFEVPGAPLDEAGEPIDEAGDLQSEAPINGTGQDSDSESASTDPAGVAEENAISVNQPASVSRIADEGSDEVVLQIMGQSWAEIQDDNEHYHLFGMVDADDSPVRLVGQAPFQVFLGDARQVELSLNGEVYDHSRHIRSNHVAQFRLR
ncbi:MAG: helix-turn-helix domain-containing protein [Pseudomonadota bacterium]